MHDIASAADLPAPKAADSRKKKRRRRKGKRRGPGRPRRPHQGRHIPYGKDYLCMRGELAGELGIAERTMCRFRLPTMYVGGRAYQPHDESIQIIINDPKRGLRRPPEPVMPWPRRTDSKVKIGPRK